MDTPNNPFLTPSPSPSTKLKKNKDEMKVVKEEEIEMKEGDAKVKEDDAKVRENTLEVKKIETKDKEYVFEKISPKSKLLLPVAKLNLNKMGNRSRSSSVFVDSVTPTIEIHPSPPLGDDVFYKMDENDGADSDDEKDDTIEEEDEITYKFQDFEELHLVCNVQDELDEVFEETAGGRKTPVATGPVRSPRKFQNEERFPYEMLSQLERDECGSNKSITFPDNTSDLDNDKKEDVKMGQGEKGGDPDDDGSNEGINYTKIMAAAAQAFNNLSKGKEETEITILSSSSSSKTSSDADSENEEAESLKVWKREKRNTPTPKKRMIILKNIAGHSAAAKAHGIMKKEEEKKRGNDEKKDAKGDVNEKVDNDIEKTGKETPCVGAAAKESDESPKGDEKEEPYYYTDAKIRFDIFDIDDSEKFSTIYLRKGVNKESEKNNVEEKNEGKGKGEGKDEK